MRGRDRWGDPAGVEQEHGQQAALLPAAAQLDGAAVVAGLAAGIDDPSMVGRWSGGSVRLVAMRRLMVLLVAALVAVVAPAPARASAGGWVPVPTAPFDFPAGERCDFPVHGEPIVDGVRTRVLATYPDGSTKRQAFVGDLIGRITNTATGASVEVDTSGSGLVVIQPGGSLTRNSTWYAVGPALIGFGEGGGDHPRGLWVFAGVYTVAFDAVGFKTVTIYHGSERNVCAEL